MCHKYFNSQFCNSKCTVATILLSIFHHKNGYLTVSGATVESRVWGGMWQWGYRQTTRCHGNDHVAGLSMSHVNTHNHVQSVHVSVCVCESLSLSLSLSISLSLSLGNLCGVGSALSH